MLIAYASSGVSGVVKLATNENDTQKLLIKGQNFKKFLSFVRNIKKQKSFTFTGLTTYTRLLLLRYIQKLSGKKVLFITSTEQSALRYGADYERLFDIEAQTIPYQRV